MKLIYFLLVIFSGPYASTPPHVDSPIGKHPYRVTYPSAVEPGPVGKQLSLFTSSYNCKQMNSLWNLYFYSFEKVSE